MIASYSSRYRDYMQKINVFDELLVPDILKLKIKMEAAITLWERADQRTRSRLLPVLVQADAVISAAIYRAYQNLLTNADEDKMKLLALKAKALLLNKQVRI